MAGAGRVRRSRRLREAPHRRAAAAGVAPEDWRDWAGGVPAEVLAKVAGKVVAQTEAGWAAWLKESAWSPKLRKFGMDEEEVEEEMAKRKRDGNCPLFVFARVCKEWRKAQIKVGGPLRTRVKSDVILPGSVALAKWALAEGCPRKGGGYFPVTMAKVAAIHGHLDLIKWLCGEGACPMDVMQCAAIGGNLELVRWLRGEGYPWGGHTCYQAVFKGDVEMLRWARENGCPWEAATRDMAAQKLGYTDDFGNLFDEDDEYGYD